MTWTKRSPYVSGLSLRDFDSLSRDTTNLVRNLHVKLGSNSVMLDLGRWCYSKTRRQKRTNKFKNSSNFEVKTNSFITNSELMVLRYFEYLVWLKNSNKTEQTILHKFYLFNYFQSWAKIKCIQKMPEAEFWNNVIKQYSDYLLERIRLKKIGYSTASKRQQEVLRALSWMYEYNDKNIAEGIYIIRNLDAATPSSTTIDEQTLQSALKYYTSVFSELSDVALKFKQYPFELALPNQKTWYFPSAKQPVLLETIEGNILNTKKIHHSAYDYRNGKIKSITDVCAQSKIRSLSHRRSYAKAKVRRARTTINEVNRDKLHPLRVHCAYRASLSFILLFFANTGMNLSQVANLTFDENNFQKFRTHADFVAVKFRAREKTITSRISPIFLKEFHIYLKVRKYILVSLKVKAVDHLFFTIRKNCIAPLEQDFSYVIRNEMRKINPTHQYLTSSQLRLFKTDNLIRQAGPIIAAQIMQNEVTTAVKHYANGSPASTAKEFTSFFNSYKSLLSSRNDKTTNLPSGQCGSFGNPTKSIYPAINEPDCQRFQGCLFCEHFSVLPDEKDLRKLLSYKHLINSTKHTSMSSEHREKVFGSTIKRLDQYIEAISTSEELTPKQFKKVSTDVYENENLSEFWMSKYRLFTELGVI